MTTHTASIEFENDEAYITIPEEMIAELGWSPGDTLYWIDNQNGTYSIVRVDPEVP
jgi:bifunctional DNA-binding transcriptional regulator/antitoxin component of YhaV-PrlF toxin-antitoxin module